MDSIRQDLGYALRFLIRAPGFAIVALVTLAIGIGANTAIFSVIYAVLLQSLPYPTADRLVIISERDLDAFGTAPGVSPPNFVDWHRFTQTLEGLSVFLGQNFTVKVDGTPRTVSAYSVSPGFFSMLGVKSSQGRGFQQSDLESGAAPVVVLTHEFWQRYYSGRDLVGSLVTLDQDSFQVVGILPPGFEFLERSDLFLVKRFAPDELADTMRGARYMRTIGLLKPSITVEQAEAELNSITGQAAGNSGWEAVAQALRDHVVGDFRFALSVLFGAVAFLLLIACTNVANLLLSRSWSRRHEIALRAAVGASRARLMRQTLTETVLLFLLAAAAGLVVALWAVESLVALAPQALPRLDSVSLSMPVLAFTLGVSVICGLVFGWVPALRHSRHDLSLELKGAGGPTPGFTGANRLGNALIVGEVALAVALLVGAGLMGRSLLELQRVSLGFEPEDVQTLFLSLPQERYGSDRQRAQFFERLLQDLNTVPGIEAAGGGTNLPLAGSNMMFGYRRLDQSEMSFGQYHAVTPGYFDALNIERISGRWIQDEDRATSRPVVVVNQTLADRLFPPDTAVGQRIVHASRGGTVEREIVGVVADIKHSSLDTASVPELYVPYAQDSWGFLGLVMKKAGDAPPLRNTVSEAVWRIDPELPVEAFGEMEDFVAGSLAPYRFQAVLLAIFSGISLLLAAVGIYGVIAFVVGEGLYEMGVRVVLGAQRQKIFTAVVKRGLGLTAGGLAIGLTAAYLLSRFISGLLYGVSPLDPATFLSAALAFLIAGFMAAAIPARKAMRVDPIETLRAQ